MSEVWPLDVRERLSNSGLDAIRPFKCLLLMPFEGRFNQVAEVIRETLYDVFEKFPKFFEMEKAEINRLDWVTSSGVIQQEIWEEIHNADLIFCDITGYNPNVMFESGVCAAWKNMRQVVFIKDHFFKQQSAFDISPIRYTEYELTSDGIRSFQQKIRKLAEEVLIGFPDRQGEAPRVITPIEIDFSQNKDDKRLFTPPFTHRRIINGSLEIGSLAFFAHSWASLGKEQFLNFSLEFSAKFSNPISEDAWIGVGFRSQHYYANFAHILYLKRDGSITITEPNEEQPNFYADLHLRDETSIIDEQEFRQFKVTFDEKNLSVSIDDFHHVFDLAKMKKVFGPGLIRFQSSLCWIAIGKIKIVAV